MKKIWQSFCLCVCVLFLFGVCFIWTKHVVASGDLVGWWKLNEASGDAYDTSGSRFTLTSVNASFTSGKIDGAASFNGTNAYFNGTGPNLANRSFSISSWLYANNLSADQVWLNIGLNSVDDQALHLRLTTTGALRFGFFSDDLDTANSVFSAGAWHQVVYTYDATTNQRVIYIDGDQKASDIAGGDFSGTSDTYLGSWQSDEFWNGKIDDVKIYSRVLTSSEIADLAAGGTGPIPTSAVADVSWNEVQPVGNVDDYWASAKTSQNGNVILMGTNDGNGLYLSKDRGATWSTLAPLGHDADTWFATGVNAEGNVIMAATYGGRVFLSKDSGDSWKDTLAAGDVDSNWVAGDISADGQTMIAGVSTGRLYVSKDGGSTWSETKPAGNTDKAWNRAVVSSDGGVMLAAVYSGRVYRSTNQGESWVEVQPAGNSNLNWNVLSLDKQGRTMLVGIDDAQVGGTGKIYISRDTGATWTENTPGGIEAEEWRVGSMSNNGQTMLAGFADGNYGRLWLSQDSGRSWTETQPVGNVERFWNAGAISADGYTYVAAAGNSSGVRRVYVATFSRPAQQSDSHSESSQVAQPTECTAFSPTGSPDLFQIDAASDKAKLYFSPVVSNTDRYYVSFGNKPGVMQFGTEVVGNSNSVMSYTIDHLSPKSTYYIRVRAGNDCATGEWSNEMKFTTAKKGSTSGYRYYKNFATRVVASIARFVQF